MGTTENESAWSTTAATNANSDAGINWAEGQDAATVNNSNRSMMAARAKARLDQGGAIVAGGTPNALTATTNQVLSAAHLTLGQRLTVYAPSANTTTAVTLAVDGLTAYSIKRSDGSALAVGSIKAGMFLDVVFTGASDWRALNIPPLGTGFASSSLASFSAYLASSQNVLSTAVTIVAIDTETHDTGSYFASPSWTPPIGTVLITASLSFSSVTAGLVINAGLYRDGVAVATNANVAGASAAATSMPLTYIGQVTGSNVFNLRVSSSDSNYTIDNGSSMTFFAGTMI